MTVYRHISALEFDRATNTHGCAGESFLLAPLLPMRMWLMAVATVFVFDGGKEEHARNFNWVGGTFVRL